LRYERKYKIESISAAIVRQVVINHPASFRKIFPDRKVNNIYFDNSALSAYFDNVEGVSERQKFRVRWYGDDIFKIEKPKLEIKIKSNQLGYKKSFPANEFQLNDLTKLTREVSSKSQSFNLFQPTLINSYLRSYYGTTDGKYRITIDRQLQYFSLLNAIKFTRYQIEDQAVVLELKYDETLDDDAAFVLQYIPFRFSKSSKYVTGLNLLVGDF
jgi:SPX domain protein involved in polyphosphate accumulation